MRALLTGGTGLLGGALHAQLPEVVALSRDPARAAHRLSGARVVRWDPMTEAAPAEALEGAQAIFHLAGEPVAQGRWTAAKKQRIRDSRLRGTHNLIEGLRALDERPAVLVCASAVGYYGDRGDEALDESSAPGRDFLAEVCEAWEAQALAAVSLGVRVVCVRIGLVLAKSGGALPRMLAPFKMGVGGRLGGGQQWMPWIHIEDVIGLLLHASQDATLRGPLNAVSPQPATNAEFTQTLGRVLRRPTLLPVPQAALRLAFGEMGGLLTASQRVLPREAQRAGYAFKRPVLEEALRDLLAAP